MLNRNQIKELLLQALETEQGGVEVYTTALGCTVDKELRKEWQGYLAQTREHVERVEALCKAFDVDSEEETPGRLVVRHLGESLVVAMNMASETAGRRGAQLVATECVVLAETKDHANWELLGELAAKIGGDTGRLLREAHEKIEEEEDAHLFHTQGWNRELWIEALGMPSVLPPPEEEKNVRSAAGAQRAKAARKQMI